MSRILVIVYEAYARDSRVRRHCRALAVAGYEVEVLAVNEPRSAQAAAADGVSFAPLLVRKYRGGSRLAYIAAYLAFTANALLVVANRVVRRRVDLVYVNNPPDLLVFAGIPARMRGIPVVMDVHDLMSELYGAKFGRGPGVIPRTVGIVERASFRFADALVTVHDAYRDRIAAVAGDAKPVVGVWNVPDASGWTDVGDARAAAPPPTGDVLRLGHHGTIVERFGVATALDALAILRQRGVNASLTILGDGDYADQVESRVRRLGLEDAVRFDRRMFVPDDLPSFASEIDVGIAPYRPSPFTEGSLPTKVLEYLALGVPTVVTGTEMVRAHLSDAVRVIAGGSATELADAIEELRDPAVRQRYVAAGRPLARQFDWASQRGKLTELIDTLVARRRRRRRGPGTPAA